MRLQNNLWWSKLADTSLLYINYKQMFLEILHKEQNFYTAFCSSLKPTEILWEQNYSRLLPTIGQYVKIEQKYTEQERIHLKNEYNWAHLTLTR